MSNKFKKQLDGIFYLKVELPIKFEVDAEDLSCTSQLTNGRKEITLITCTNDSKMRVIVKAKSV